MNIKTIVFFAVRLAACQSPALSVTGCWMTGTSALPKPRNPADALAKSSSDSKNTPIELNGFRILPPLL